MKQKLLLIAGAGASVEFGMPSVNDIDSLMCKWSHEYAPVPGTDMGLYGYIKMEIKNFASQNGNNWLENIIDFESILYAIQLLTNLHTDLERRWFHNPLNPFIELRLLPVIHKLGKTGSASGENLRGLRYWLVDKLLLHFRSACRDLKAQRQDLLAEQKRFLDILNEQYQLGIINFNYDNVIDSSRPDLTTGFREHDGSFDRGLIYDQGWNFNYHIHGSVHFDMKGGKDTEMHKIFWNPNLDSVFSGNSAGRNDFISGEGDAFLTSSIITGLGKSYQIQREPFGCYFMQLDRLIFEADRILFIGYGFNDLHLNNFIPFIRFDEEKIRKVMIIDYAGDTEDGLSFRHDSWSFGLGRTIPFNGRDMRHTDSASPHAVGYYKTRKIFERSSDPKFPLSVWYNGYEEAMRNARMILEELA